MAEFFEYDPLTKVTSYFDYDETTGVASIRKEQDIQPFLDYAAEVRNTRIADKRLKRDDYFCLYAIIPPVVQTALMNKGINIHDPGATKRMLEEINRNYPWLKTTDMKHG